MHAEPEYSIGGGWTPRLSTRHETERTRVEARDSEMYTCEWTLDSDGLPIISALIWPPGLTSYVCGAMSCARAACLVSPTNHERAKETAAMLGSS